MKLFSYIRFLINRQLEDYKTFKTQKKFELLANKITEELQLIEQKEVENSIQLSAIAKQKKKLEDRTKRVQFYNKLFANRYVRQPRTKNNLNYQRS